jgi:hypothetical protein
MRKSYILCVCQIKLNLIQCLKLSSSCSFHFKGKVTNSIRDGLRKAGEGLNKTLTTNCTDYHPSVIRVRANLFIVPRNKIWITKRDEVFLIFGTIHPNLNCY